MKAIFTKYIPCGAVRGARIKAYTGEQSLTMSYPHELSHDAAHTYAAHALCKKMNWKNIFLAMGADMKGRGNVYVMLDKRHVSIADQLLDVDADLPSI